MKYIWEAVTKNRLGDSSLSDVSFVPARNFSPYMEVNFENLNETDIPSDLRIEVNPFIRFNSIFGSYMRPEFSEFSEYKDAVFDILMHLLLAADKKSGHDRRSIRRLLIVEDIQNGAFGNGIENDFALLDDEGREAIADGLISVYEHGISVYLHNAICKKLFPNMIPYLKIRGKRTLLLYLGCHKTPRGEAGVTLCQRLFLPEDLKTGIFWDKHFGIIGIPETMRLGETVLV
jgi:hypothetical protein